MITKLNSIVTKFRNSKVFRNSFFTGFGWALGAIINFISIPYIVKKMGIETFGVYALITAIIGYLSVMDFGIGQSVVKFVSEYNAQGAIRKVVATINNAITLLFILGLIGSLLIIFFSGPFILLFKVPAILYDDTKLALLISSILFLLTLLISGLSSVINGLQRFDISSKLILILNSSLVVFTVILLMFSAKLSYIILMNSFLSAVFVALFLRKIFFLIPEYRFRFEIEKQTLKPLLHFGGYLAISRIANIIFTQFDKIFIGFIVGTAGVAYYAVPTRLMSSLMIGFSSIGFTIMPMVSEIQGNDQLKHQTYLYIKATKYIVMFATPLFLIFIVLSKRFMNLWIGAEFAEHSWFIMSIVGISYYLGVTTNILWNVALGMGKSKLQAYFSIGLAVLSLGALYPMTLLWGVEGTALAILMGSLLVPCTFYYMNKKVFHIHQWKFFKHVFFAPLIASGFGFAIIGSLNSFFPYTLVSFILLSVSVVAIYFGLYYIVNTIVKVKI